MCSCQLFFEMESLGSLLSPSPDIHRSSLSLKTPLVIYLKDKTFIPDFIDLKLNRKGGENGGVDLQLCNSDGVTYHITCHGFKDYQNMRVGSNKSIILTFQSSGKFELTCPESALMKVRTRHELFDPCLVFYSLFNPFPSSPSVCC
jgi:hypothetical protein